MNKADITRIVMQKTGIPRREVTDVINAFIETATDTLSSGESVLIAEFGKFAVKQRQPRRVRDWKNGEFYTMDAYIDVKFDVSDAFHDRLNKKK